MISRTSSQITINFSTDAIRRKSVAIMSSRIKNNSPIFNSASLKKKSNSELTESLVRQDHLSSKIKRKSSILSRSFVWIGARKIPKLDLSNIRKTNDNKKRCRCPTTYGNYDLIFVCKESENVVQNSNTKSKKWNLIEILFGSRK